MSEHIASNVEDLIRQHADVVRGHDHVHPDRNECRGVGGCALMRAEHDAREEIRDLLELAARSGVRLTVTGTRDIGLVA